MRIFEVRSVCAVAWAIAIVCGLAGCKAEKLAHPEARQAYESLVNTPVERPLARVNGRDLLAAEFEAFWAEHAELTRDDAIQAWLEREVLAQHAEKVIAQDSGALAFARKQGMVRALLRDEIEKTVKVGDEKVDERLEKVREHVRARTGQPAGVRASHLLIHVPKEHAADGLPGAKPEPVSETERAAMYETAHEWALKIRESLGNSATLDDLYRAQERFAGEIPQPLALAVNAHLSFAVPVTAVGEAEEKPQPSKIPPGWLGVVREFADGAAAMRGSAAGTISEPVRSEFGWHLIRFEKEFPEVAADAREVEKQALEETIRAERARRFGELSGELVERSTVNLFPQIIEQQGQIHGQ